MIELGDVLGCHQQLRLEEKLEAVNLQAVDLEGGAVGAETLVIAQLVILEMCRDEYNKVH